MVAERKVLNSNPVGAFCGRATVDVDPNFNGWSRMMKLLGWNATQRACCCFLRLLLLLYNKRWRRRRETCFSGPGSEGTVHRSPRVTGDRSSSPNGQTSNISHQPMKIAVAWDFSGHARGFLQRTCKPLALGHPQCNRASMPEAGLTNSVALDSSKSWQGMLIPI